MTHSTNNQPPIEDSDQDKDVGVDAAIAPPVNSDLPDPILAVDRKSTIDHPTATALGAAPGLQLTTQPPVVRFSTRR